MLLRHLASSQGQGPALRVALLVEGSSLPRPYALAVDHIRRSNFARLELVIREERAPDEQHPFRVPCVRHLTDPSQRSRLFFDMYTRWDRRRSTFSDALLSPVDLADRLDGLPSVIVEPILDGGVLAFPQDALARIREFRIDVGIRSGSHRLRGDVLSVARCGIWSFRYGDPERYRGGPAFFWELAEGNPLSGVSLEVVGQDGGMILCKGLASSTSEYSVSQNRIKPELLGSTFIIRKLKELHEHGFASLEQNAMPAATYHGKRKTYSIPSNWDMAKFLVPRLAGKARTHLLERRTLEQWRVAVRVNGASRFASGRPFGTEGFRFIEAPRGRLYADPCLIERRGQVYCFFEDLDHAQHKGRISCAAVDNDGRFQDVRPALELPYHVSYPFVFEDGGEIFMVPESRRNRTVDLFCAVEFPHRWRKVITLLDGPGLDTTVLRHNGHYWFFLAVREPEHAGEQLLLFYSDSLTGELRFHPRNPISADVRYCRPAGAILVEGGRLIRPSQDCSVTYGHQLHFHEIVTLTPDDYREQLIAGVLPPPGVLGVHTYNRCGAVEVVDGKRLEPVARHAIPK